MNRRRRYRRGFSVAVLVGFESSHAVFWQIFSHVVKLFVIVELDGKRTNEKILYNFHESVVNTLKSVLKDGVRSIVVTSPARTIFTKEFLEHVRKHHKYLLQSKSPNRANFAELVGSADDKLKVAELVKTKEFKELLSNITSTEADQIVGSLEKHLYGNINNSVVLYSLKEIENTVYNREKSMTTHREYLLLTDKYLNENRQKNRIHRLMQIAQNKKVKTRVVDAETSAGCRISQFGGIVFFTNV
ncbi:hypothetical protein KJN74_02740 [Candidatus Bathyarchaeota archaeon]|nr:hypothetical protein [Candidatus Bathyarchaeota archaeon]